MDSYTEHKKFYDEWRIKNEALRKKFNIPIAMGQKWNCIDDCESGCYKGCDRACYKCYIINEIS